MAATSTCHFCRSAAESRTPDGRLSVCRRCCREKLLPLIRDAIGDAELAKAVVAMQPLKSGWPGDRPAGRQLGAGRGKPVRQPQRRQMTSDEKGLCLLRARARQEGTSLKYDAREAARAAGFRVDETMQTELGTATAAAAPARRPLTAAQVEARRLAKAAGFAVHGDDVA